MFGGFVRQRLPLGKQGDSVGTRRGAIGLRRSAGATVGRQAFRADRQQAQARAILLGVGVAVDLVVDPQQRPVGREAGHAGTPSQCQM